MQPFATELEALVREAGRAILDVYRSDFAVTTKEDRTPLTLADRKSHEILSAGLGRITPHIPVLSEEGKTIDYQVRSRWQRFWLVDPLDGTKEFIKRNGEFTINVALIEEGAPRFGMVYVPEADRLFVGDVQDGAWEKTAHGTRPLKIAPPKAGDKLVIVATRSHPTPAMETFFSLLPPHERLPRGSALKFCAVAAGEADFYPRFGPTWEWDTGAGHAVVLAAGGVVVDPLGKPLAYNKKDLINGYFLVAPSLEWLAETGILEAAGRVAREG
ncbi:3'(2'),5'-bisphosphate nucleotidase [Desulfacinum hydrothermale DSM 13146]|uniref:3'(2'),5'-bisphosphate nucleotidase CysQ n=1 Tax=Desulfacinum hydrothermale DSM 13146 TaxID=1121390 RepID=A0A1W1XMC3_9BACT|nr:3'(2'),5'-bisphosphate nucleotidase CysQ [Desulfacinum hydrothermale]SMC25150.1 3'(2'),5'-bisphosphate nucleotidase [Desulfacinum hydrothermale DSM 13146]